MKEPNSKQPLLDGLSVDLQTAIKLATIPTFYEGKRKREIGSRVQRLVLQYVVRFNSRKCWQSAETIGKECDAAGVVDERTICGAIKGLVAIGLLTVTGPKNRRTKVFTEENLQRLRSLIPQNFEAYEQRSVSGSAALMEPDTTARSLTGSAALMQPDSTARSQAGSTARHNKSESKENNKEWVVVLDEFGIDESKVHAARQLGFSDQDIGERVEHFKQRFKPDDRFKNAGYLCNWLTQRWSFERDRKQVLQPATLSGRGDILPRNEIAAMVLDGPRIRAETAAACEGEPSLKELYEAGRLTSMLGAQE